MRQIFYAFIFILAGVLPVKSFAQMIIVKGVVCGLEEDGKTKYPLYGAQIKYFALPDTTEYGIATVTEEGGKFQSLYMGSLKGFDKFLVRISYIGMEDYVKECNGGTAQGPLRYADLDTVVMKTLPITLEEAVIVGKLRKMYTEGDTVIFNPSAFEMPDGSLLLELVRRLPGLQCDNAGNLTYKGRSIEEIRLNGDSFFRHDMSVALRNIPANRLELLKVYETQREDSIQNPEKQLVMDMITKEPVDKVRMARALAGIQSRDSRHLLDGGINTYIKKKTELSLGLLSSNTSDYYNSMALNEGFLLTPSSPFESNATEKLTNAGEFSLARSFKNIKVDTHITYDYNKTRQETSSLSSSYLPDYELRNQSASNSDSRSHDFRGELSLEGKLSDRVQWKLDGSVSYGKDKSYDGSDYSMAYDDRMVNSTENRSQGRSDNISMDIMAQLTHALGEKKDKTLRWNIGMNYSDEDNERLQYDYTRYHMFEDSTTHYNRYIETPTRHQWFSAGVNYNHSIANLLSLTLFYNIRYLKSTDDTRYFNL